ncbi:hypothetical protein BGZ52_007932 [Haplosporangium bisporale]|nr:hypothetical protein BGZ52_007932 [Haplosporangium bisporale]
MPHRPCVLRPRGHFTIPINSDRHQCINLQHNSRTSCHITSCHIIRVLTRLTNNPKTNRPINLGVLRSKDGPSFKEDLRLLIKHTRDPLFITHNGRLNNVRLNKDHGPLSILHTPQHHLLGHRLFHLIRPQETNF